MSTKLYVIACVFVPALWGLAMFYVFGWVDRRLRKPAKPGDSESTHADYSI